MQATKKDKKTDSQKKQLIQKILFFVNLIVLILLASSNLSWFVPPSKTLFFSYIGIAFPILLLLSVIGLLYWILAKKRTYILISIVFIALTYKPISTYFPLHTLNKNVPERSIKVLSYNIMGFGKKGVKQESRNEILNYLKSSNSDIICLQEYITESNQNGGISQRRIEKELSAYPYKHITVIRSNANNYTYGLAVYSKFPLTLIKEYKFKSSLNGAAIYKMNIHKKEILLMNVHLESNRINKKDKTLYRSFLRSPDITLGKSFLSNAKHRLSRGFRVRQHQAEMLASEFRSHSSDGKIICGDFNDTPLSYAYHTLKGDMTDAFVKNGFGVGLTYNEEMFLFRLDHIFFSKEFLSYSTKIGRKKFSDHFPIFTFLKEK